MDKRLFFDHPSNSDIIQPEDVMEPARTWSRIHCFSPAYEKVMIHHWHCPCTTVQRDCTTTCTSPRYLFHAWFCCIIADIVVTCDMEDLSKVCKMGCGDHAW